MIIELAGMTVLGAGYLVTKKRPATPLIDQFRSTPGAPVDSLMSRLTTSPVAEAGWRTWQQVKKKSFGLFSNDAYAQSIKEITLDAAELSEEEIIANQFLQLSSLLLGSSVLSAAIFPPLLLLHVPPLLYLAYPMYKEGYQDLVKQRKITTTVVDVALSLGCLAYVPFHTGIIVISTVGSWFYALTNKMVVQSKDNTRKRLADLFGEQPKLVWICKDDLEIEVPYETIQPGDTVVVHAGQMIPVDGMVSHGVASVDQRMLTGEAQPAEKAAGDVAFAATIVLTGKLYLQVEKTGAETAAAQIGEILQHTSDFTSSIQLRGKEISDQFAPSTLGVALLAALAVSPSSALAVLLSGMGYSMKMLGPLSVLNYLNLAATEGILIKDGRALEQIATVDTIVFDKTGTLTLEQPHLGAIHPCGALTEDELLRYAAAAEYRQTHPIARAIVDAAEKRQLTLPAIAEAAYEIGYGIKVLIEGQTVCVGSQRYMTMEAITLPTDFASFDRATDDKGASLVYVAIDQQLAGVIELYPTIRPEAKQIIEGLKQRGLTLYIISGDHQRPTQALAEELGIANYFAETLPEHKADHIDRLCAENRKVCFVGDGINDSIALKKAHVSISLKGASTIAIDTAQVILMDQTLQQLERLFTLSEEFERNMKSSLVTSIVPGAVTIGGALIGVVGFGAAMGLSVVGGLMGVGNAMLPLLQAGQKSTSDSVVRSHESRVA